MVDIHSHLIYGVDDGVQTLDESIDIIKDLYNVGFTDLIITPHYIHNTNYANDKNNNLTRLNIIKNELNKNNININIYLGNEIYIDDDIENLIINGLASSLNNTNFLLIELPMSGEYDNYLDIFKYLISKEYTVILAHPERYLSIQEDFNLIYELKNIGVLFQSNYDSILGKYGNLAKEVFIRLLNERLITFISTDIHRKKHNYKDYEIAKELMLNYISLEELNEITKDNAKKYLLD